MQEYTSLETSKQLYEMFGWSDTPVWFGNGDTSYIKHSSYGVHFEANDAPAYSLPYLLDKLPSRWWIKYRGDDYVAKWDNRTFEHFVSASTPVEAAALLCLELGERGILPKVNKTTANVDISDEM